MILTDIRTSSEIPFIPLNEEPLLEVEQIQGNILGGFNKDFQQFLFFEIVDPVKVKKWLQLIIPQVKISTAKEVVTFNRLYKTMYSKIGSEPKGVIASWVNIAFSFQGLKKLVPDESMKDFSKRSPFVQGMQSSAGILGDPIRDEAAEGNPKNWVLGGERNSPEILLLIASDSESELNRIVEEIKNTVVDSGSSVNNGLKLVYEEAGRVRPDLPGHEHFGFRDGISQPGVRGLFSTAPGDTLTKRWIEPTDKAFQTDAEPGEKLIWPGEFVFGYAKQNDLSSEPTVVEESELPNYGVPVWAKNGSFLVVRRLRQDVEGFWKFLSEKAAEVNLSAELLGAKMVGRWPLGAPIMRSPKEDNAQLAKDDHANNNFLYESDTPEVKLQTHLKYSDPFLKAKSDIAGNVCPFSAHIRKVNPRDFQTDAGPSSIRRILRRGIPFGPPLKIDPKNPTASLTEDAAKGNRGLMFLCYQTDIKRQFEFISQSWANNKEQPHGSGGQDPIIGQNDEENRVRQFTYEPNKSFDIMKEFVIPTGGEYYFQPSINALENIIS
ncbi:Dyp-type peroxidase [Paenibacillus aurantiacus]|uniref:Dyp-type peroxidase n=1 Tax=Paenibacillus aurantiacus TaxID=1936118 RepID=A0ABV5KR62_9BACL